MTFEQAGGNSPSRTSSAGASATVARSWAASIGLARKRTAGLPVVMLSAKCQTTDVKTGLASGAQVYLVKPFAPQELVRQVNRWVAQRRAAIGLIPLEAPFFAVAS
jgi:CheY-like chemotaxis protein